jgi:SAM-dependent methyltransferase
VNPLRWAYETTRKRGLLHTAQIARDIVVDFAFDWRYGTDTRRRIYTAQIATESANKIHSGIYQATRAQPLLRLLKTLPLPRDGTFVDIGCGKGRVLLIASECGFDKVLGIEFSGALCDAARRNVQLYARRSPLKSPIEVIEADAANHVFGSREKVLFLYNPFGRTVLQTVLTNVGASLRAHPRKLHVIYHNPVDRAVIEDCGLFGACEEHTVGGSRFLVYSNTADVPQSSSRSPL